ncbi:MAG: hypothetical protein Q7W30_06030 [Coriobacteriia bacterium]|nr:hypothetical protein [Coriobacteriia bacterium]
MSPEAKETRGGSGRIALWAGAGIVAAIAVAVVAALVLTAGPGYFAKYSSLTRRHTTLQTSAHKNLPCDACHVDSRGTLVSAAAKVGDFYRGLVATPGEPLFVALPAPSNGACLACHRYDWSEDSSRTMKVPHPAHLRVVSETRECVKCHKWTAHEETYQERHKSMPFSGVCASFACHVGTKPLKDCANCHHVLQEGRTPWKASHRTTVRSYGPNACLEKCHAADQCRLCHTTGKTPVFSSNVATAGVSAIERLHVKKDWIAQHGTIALQDPAKCLVCHVSEGECNDCHAQRPAFHGPKSTWLARHKAVSKDERRCLTCHKKPWCDECHKQFKEMR